MVCQYNAKRTQSWLPLTPVKGTCCAGDPDAAVKYFAKAVQEDPDNLEYKIHLQRSQEEAARTHTLKGKELERTDQLDAALADPGVVARQIGKDALSPQCRRCPVVDVCGGGHYAHRYAGPTGFQHPSVYCVDMRRLIDHIADALREHLRRRAAAEPVEPA